MLSRTHTFPGNGLVRAIAATFARRETEIPTGIPDGLSEFFAADRAKQRQWEAFVSNLQAETPPLAEIVRDIAAFLLPHADAARRQ